MVENKRITPFTRSEDVVEKMEVRNKNIIAHNYLIYCLFETRVKLNGLSGNLFK